MRFRIPVTMFVLSLAACVIPVAAHHSIATTFDTSREVTIQGVVTKVEWKNPHTLAWVDARNDDGTISSWAVELAPPNALRRSRGMDFIKAGDQVTVVLWSAKDGSRLANPLSLTFSDGRVINFSRDTTNGWKMLESPK